MMSCMRLKHLYVITRAVISGYIKMHECTLALLNATTPSRMIVYLLFVQVGGLNAIIGCPNHSIPDILLSV